MSIAQRAYTATGSSNALVQSVTIGSAGDVPLVLSADLPFDFGGAATGTVADAISSASGTSTAKTCSGARGVLLKTEFSAAGSSVKVRIWLKDPNGTTGWVPHPKLPSSGTTLSSLGVATATVATLKSTYYHGECLDFETLGASGFMVQYLAGSGSRSIWYGLR